MAIPPAYQSPTPFGANTGGLNPAFARIKKEAAFDSWLTVGIVKGDSGNELGVAGMSADFKSWNEGKGINNDDCGIFWMNPTKTRATNVGPVVLAQLTVSSSFTGVAQMGMEGKTTGGQTWREDKVKFTLN